MGNAQRGWYQPESLPPLGTPMGGTCERCGALEHEVAIHSICGAHGQLARQCRPGPPIRMDANAMFGCGIGVPEQGA